MSPMIWKAWRNETIPLMAVLIALAGLFLGQLSILLAGLFFWVLTLIASRLARRTLEGMTVSTVLANPTVEIGKSIESELIVKNPLPWPILDVQWKIDLPQSLKPSGAGATIPTSGSSRQTLHGSLWVGGHQRVRIRYRLTGLARGRWNIGPGSLVFKDPLSWNELVREDATLYHLTVWPRRYALPDNFWSSSAFMGALRGNPWDTPDPLRVVGVRPYNPGDPVRQVASYASARMARLMVKQLEPVVDRSVEILLHPKTTERHWHGVDRELLEDTISACATVVESAILKGIRTGLSSSGAVPGHVRGLTWSAEKRHRTDELLTALAWMQPSGTMDDDLEHILARLNRHIKPGTILVLVSPFWPDSLTQAFAHHARHGARVIFITTLKERPPVPSWVQSIWHCNKGEWSRG